MFFLKAFKRIESSNIAYRSFRMPEPKVAYLLIVVIVTMIAPTITSAQGVRREDSPEAASELRRAAELLRSGQPDAAEPILRRVLVSNPNNADAHNLLGVILDQGGEPTKAEREYRTALRLNPNNVSAMANLAVLLAHTKRDDEAIKTFESVLRAVPDHPQATVNLGLLYASRNDYQRAAELLARANELQPQTFDILYHLGVALYSLQRLDEADSAFEAASSLSTNSAEPFYFLGLIASARGQDESASELFGKALAHRANYPEANFMLGEILAKRKRYAEAIGFYERAVALDKTKSVYFVRLGGTYLLNYEPAKAFQYFKEAAERFPEIAEIKYFFAIAARSLGEYDLAFSEAKKALAIKETADTNALLGSMLIDRNDYPEAEKYLRKAVALNPNHFNSQHDMGRILIKQQKFAEALSFLQRAASLMPNIADVHYQLFLTYTRLKRKAEADKEFALFKQLSNEK